MAQDFEDVHDIGDLDDGELAQVVRTHLSRHPGLDSRDISVAVTDGVVHLRGRVGTAEEVRIAERIVDDELGVESLKNELVADPLRRGTNPEAADEELAVEERRDGLLLGDRPVPLEPSAEHLDRAAQERVQDEGTTDVGDSIENGAPWVPPQRPTPEGSTGVE